MNKHVKLLFGALISASALSGMVWAGSVQPVDQATQKDLISKVTAEGYTDVRNIVTDGERYIVDAKKNGKQVHLFLSKSGAVQTIKDGEHKQQVASQKKQM